MTKKKNPSIKCDVTSCKYNNCEENYCSLDEIKVSCTCDQDEADSKEDAICASFECDHDNEKEA